MSGWIKLHRKLTEWEWYSDVNTSRVFLHLLLVANHKDNQWRGIPIKRGQRLTSLSKLADETSLSVKNIRTAIKRLKSTNELASHSTAQHTVFTIINYDLYQSEASETANEGQANGKQVATNKNDKNEDNLSKVDSFDYQAVVNSFNKVMTRSPKVSKLSDKRKRAVRNLFKFAKFNISDFEGYLGHIHSTPSWDWCFRANTGSNGINYKKKSFDYFMKQEVYLEAYEEVNDNEQ